MTEAVTHKHDIAAARYHKCLAIRDLRRRQLAEAERDLAIATDALVAALYGGK